MMRVTKNRGVFRCPVCRWIGWLTRRGVIRQHFRIGSAKICAGSGQVAGKSDEAFA